MRGKWLQDVETYVQGALGLTMHFSPALEAKQWPLHVAQAYEARHCRLLTGDFMALRVREDAGSPSTLRKHADWIQQRTGLRSLFVFDRLSAYQRRSLIDGKLPFVCPGNQLFLPDLGIDLREHLASPRMKITRLTPAAQVLVLACVHRKISLNDPFTGVALAGRFGYTKMTMARALDQLRERQWIETEGSRQFSRHRFILGGRELWDQARPLLQSPVTKRLYLDEWLPGERFKAGESALAELTLLGRPRRAIWAITSEQWMTFRRESGIHLVPEAAKDNAHAEFEVWRYEPTLLAVPPLVDSLSLILSLQGDPDERIQMALDDVLRKFPW